MTDEPQNELPESEVPGNQELTLISVPAELPLAVELKKDATAHAAEVDVPTGAFIGRYRIQRQLGRGGFGVVYLAHDSELDRPVAIKLPHLHRVQDDDDRRMYLTEARTLARLDHPSIVPVYDFGVIPDRRCFVVSKFIDGKDLSRLMANERLEISRVVKWTSPRCSPSRTSSGERNNSSLKCNTTSAPKPRPWQHSATACTIWRRQKWLWLAVSCVRASVPAAARSHSK